MLSADRFWNNCATSTVKECWLWVGYIGKDGYGIMQFSDGRNERAHRIAYRLATRRRIKSTECIRHRCKEKACVNPHHLYASKKRVAKQHAESNGRSKLKATDVSRIRALAKTKTNREIAREYKVAPSTINRVIRRKTWKQTIC